MDVLLDNITSQTLINLESTQKEFWNISRSSGVLINMLIKMTNRKYALEIGTSNGYSGLWITNALKYTGGRLTTIEYFDKRQAEAVKNFKKCHVYDIVRTLQGSAIKILENLSSDEIFDFVFIDANKSEYVSYFELVKPHLTKNALIIADNITSHSDKVKPFIDAVDSDIDFQYQIINEPAGMLIAYRNN